MEKREKSKNYYDVLAWVKKVIESCKTMEQLRGANKLIKNFTNTRTSVKGFAGGNDHFDLVELHANKMHQILNGNVK